MPELTRFEKSEYFGRLFPSLKIQKPGYDLYGTSTTFLGCLALYTFLYYSHMQIDPTSLIESVKASNNIFMGEMALCLISIISLIIIERYINRTDTKKVSSNGLVETGKENKKSIFSVDELLKRKSTQRSMTLAVKTMKTSDINMENGGVK